MREYVHEINILKYANARGSKSNLLDWTIYWSGRRLTSLTGRRGGCVEATLFLKAEWIKPWDSSRVEANDC